VRILTPDLRNICWHYHNQCSVCFRQTNSLKGLLNNQTDIDAGNIAEVGHYHTTLFNSFIGTQNQIPWLAILDINGKL